MKVFLFVKQYTRRFFLPLLRLRGLPTSARKFHVHIGEYKMLLIRTFLVLNVYLQIMNKRRRWANHLSFHCINETRNRIDSPCYFALIQQFYRSHILFSKNSPGMLFCRRVQSTSKLFLHHFDEWYSIPVHKTIKSYYTMLTTLPKLQNSM